MWSFRIVGVAVASTHLGKIHRPVCLLEQVFQGVGIGWINRDADACRDPSLFAPETERRVEFLNDMLSNAFDGRRIAEVWNDNGEFVATQARKRVGLAHPAAYALRGFGQQDVALVVTERVVDFLEMVEVDEQ